MAAKRAPLPPQAKAILKGMAGYEEVDSLMRGNRSLLKRADYLLESRTIIIEQKEITKYKWLRKDDLREFKNSVIARYGVDPLTRGMRFDQLSSDELQRLQHIMLNDVDIIRDAIEKANRQICDTKTLFEIPNAVGVLLLICDRNEYLLPQAIATRLKTALDMKLGDEFRYPHVECAVAFCRAKGFLVDNRTRFNLRVSREGGPANDFGIRLQAKLTQLCSDIIHNASLADARIRIVS